MPMLPVEDETSAWVEATSVLLTDTAKLTGNAAALRQRIATAEAAANKRVELNQAKATQLLQQKLAQTSSLTEAIQEAITELQEAIDQLAEATEVAEQRLELLDPAFHAAQARLGLRSQRPQREDINDPVHRALASQVRALGDASKKMAKCIRESHAHVAAMQTLYKCLQLDLADKKAALQADRAALGVVELALPTDIFAPRAVKRLPKAMQTFVRPLKFNTPPQVWMMETKDRVQEVRKLVITAAQHRRNLSVSAAEAAEISGVATGVVEAAVEEKLERTEKLIEQLNAKRAAIDAELVELATQKAHVMDTLAQKERPLTVVLQRLSLRRHRPARECVHDAAADALQEELAELKNIVSQLQQKLRQLEGQEERLHSLRRQITIDIEDKEAALEVERQVADLDEGLFHVPQKTLLRAPPSVALSSAIGPRPPKSPRSPLSPGRRAAPLMRAPRKPSPVVIPEDMQQRFAMYARPV
eukprot:TRINITY_DN43834_c0_g1_i1.p1 TRINITY_DN43834_c0_g1~~TRINITY_DN43834_c0_g1_i1.p1  ORF type:complete len:475 (-),score=107.05 TRINITY_DN43834_c0_g1_i1:39-1463(-)